jgi:hypothetical protein
MANQETVDNQQSLLGHVEVPSGDRIDLLRAILEQQQHRTITYDEALDVGSSLISFFEILAEEA